MFSIVSSRRRGKDGHKKSIVKTGVLESRGCALSSIALLSSFFWKFSHFWMIGSKKKWKIDDLFILVGIIMRDTVLPV
jgi:hypothetical protein